MHYAVAQVKLRSNFIAVKNKGVGGIVWHHHYFASKIDDSANKRASPLFASQIDGPAKLMASSEMMLLFAIIIGE